MPSSICAIYYTLSLEKAAELLDAYLNVRFSTLITAAHEERLVEKKSRLCFSVLEDADAYELMLSLIHISEPTRP